MDLKVNSNMGKYNFTLDLRSLKIIQVKKIIFIFK